jgi:hypothetical protein
MSHQSKMIIDKLTEHFNTCCEFFLLPHVSGHSLITMFLRAQRQIPVTAYDLQNNMDIMDIMDIMDSMDTMDDHTCPPVVHTVHTVHSVHSSLWEKQ